jgi:periplasmic protein TonB
VVDTDTDARVDPFVCRDLNMRSAVLAPSFPNKNDKNFTVVLEMFSSRARNFSAEQIVKLEQLAEVAGVLAVGDSAEADALKAEALASAANTSGEGSENPLFAQDELDHLVDRFISDLKIGGPVSPNAATPVTKAPTSESKPADVKKPPAFVTSYSAPKTETLSSVTAVEKRSAPKPFEKQAAAATGALPANKLDSHRKATEKSADLELVPLAEPVSTPRAPKRDAIDHAELTLGQHPEAAGSKVPIIAIAALAVAGLIGGGIYVFHGSGTSAKPAVQATAPAPVAPISDPNTSMTVTATPLPETKQNTSSAAGESAKKPSAPEAKTEKESRRSEEAKAEPALPTPIVLASGKHTPTETLAPMAAPSISMPTGAAPPPADMPVSTSTPELAASARSTGVTQGVLIHRVSPKYPASARSYALSGEVVLKGRITKDGNVDQLKTLSGNPLLATAAIEAVRQWKYEPYKVNGNPIDMETTFRIEFSMPK